jgi:DNA-binding winged helix-turn-helix (wHTH) protein/Tol biopolymer transport system component
MSKETNHFYEFGPFRVDPGRQLLLRDGHPVPLTSKAFETLLALMQHGEQMVSKDELMKQLWPDTFVEESNLAQQISMLRKALGESPQDRRYIVTMPGRGYRFALKVRELSDRGDLVVQSHSVERVTVEGIESRGHSAAVASFSRRVATAFVALTLIVISGFAGYGLHRWTSRSPSPNFERLRFTKLTSSGKAEDAAISPDGNYIVYSQRDRKGSGLWLRQVSSGSDVQILPSEDPNFRGLTFSPDGNSIYFVRERKDSGTFRDLYAMAMLGGPYRLLTRDIDSPVSFSPDGHQFVYTRGIGLPDGNEIRVANADGSKDRPLATVYGTSFSYGAGAAWSPNGGTIAVSFMLRGQRSGYVLDSVSAVDGSVREVIWNAGVIGRPLWLPEGDKILVDVDDSSGRGQLWTIAFPNGERRRVTNDLANWGIRIDAPRDSKSVIAVQWAVSANIWESGAANPSAAKPITSGEMPLVAAVQAATGEVLAVSGDGRMWMMNEDGTERRPFSNLRDVAPPVMCGQFAVLTAYAFGGGEYSQADAGRVNGTKMAIGRFVVQRSYQTGPANIVRIDADGLNSTTLARGLVYSPTCSPDGKFLFYVSMGNPQKIMRIPIEGGEPTAIAEIPGLIRGTMEASPDGQFLALPYDYPTPALKLAVISINRGRIQKTFDLPPRVYLEACLRWSPNGKALQYLLTLGDVTNIWEQPLAGGSPKRVTNFTSSSIFDFNWSPDGKRLLMSRGEVSSDVVVLSNLR